MPFSFETFAWAVSALFQLLAVCAYLLSFPHVDGVCDQLPDIDGVDDQLEGALEVSVGARAHRCFTVAADIELFQRSLKLGSGIDLCADPTPHPPPSWQAQRHHLVTTKPVA